MNIVVCVKQVADPEAPPSSFRIDVDSNKVVLPTDIPPVLDPYSEYAVEAALKLKDTHGGKVTTVSLGTGFIKDVIKKPLAMGADELILLEDEAFTGSDSWSTAYALAAAIRKTGDYDLILCGRQSSDRDAGQTGSGIAALLGVPVITLVRKIDIAGGKVKVERLTADGYEVLDAQLPKFVQAILAARSPAEPS